MRRFATVLAVISAIRLAALTPQAAEYHVKQDGSGDFTVIQEAIDAAQYGDTIVVHPGTYYENARFSGKNIKLTSTEPGEWGVVEATVIDGGQNGPVVAFDGTEDESCLLSGLTITNGKNGYGGGICGARKWDAPHTKASIQNCVVTGNAAADAVGASGGGLMWCGGEISNCTISKNYAGWGGGLAECYGCRLEDCLIIENTAQRTGGGVFKFEGIIQGCSFRDNSASYGAGGLHECKADITDCDISGNTGGSLGGGISVGSGNIIDCSITNNRGEWGGGLHDWLGDVMGCNFIGNSAVFGGGICDLQGDVIGCVMNENASLDLGTGFGAGIQGCAGDIKHCTISNNNGSGLYDCCGTISDCTISGNVAWIGAGLQSCCGLLENCVIRDNLADMSSGGGICNFEGTIRNCLIIGNVTEGCSGGGICYCYGQIENCTIAGNSAIDSGGGAHCISNRITNSIVWGNSAPEGSEVSMDWVPQVTYCCIKDWTAGGVGNIAADPLFAAGALGEYYLSSRSAGQASDSPCIDAGSDTAENLGLDEFTTRTDDGRDKRTVDIGYHHPVIDVTLEPSLNASEFAPGETLEAFLSVGNHGSQIMVDVYVGLILPGGAVLCFCPDGARYGIFPYAPRILMETDFNVGPLNVFSMTIPENTLSGSYSYASALTRTGGDDFIAVSTSSFVIYCD